MKDYATLFSQLSNIKVAIIGDIMLDTYWWGNVERISPEAPVPIVAVKRKEERIGGAGNVALNTSCLQAPTTVFSVIGNDLDAEHLIALLQKSGVNTDYLVQDAQRPTTNKIRIMGRSQQMMRIDEESTESIDTTQEEALIANFKRYVVTEKPAVVILEDYNKGVLTENVIKTIIAICKENNIITTVDPKSKNFFAYKGVDVFKPNLKEVREAMQTLGITLPTTSLDDIHTQLTQQLHHRISLITLSEKGVFYGEDATTKIIPGYVRTVADVSGAGDTVIAVMSLMYALTHETELSAHIANIAGGLVCEEVGTAALHKDLLLKECEKLKP